MAFALLGLLAAGEAGVVGRLDMGERLRRLDAAWSVAPLERRMAAMGGVNSAVMGFFGGQASSVCRALDAAVGVLEGVEGDGVGRALVFRVNPAVYEPGEVVEVTLGWAYEVPPGAGVEVEWEGGRWRLGRGEWKTVRHRTQLRAVAAVYPPFMESLRGTEGVRVDGEDFGSGSAWLVGARGGYPVAAGSAWEAYWKEVLPGARSEGHESAFAVADAGASFAASEGRAMPRFVRAGRTLARVEGEGVLSGKRRVMVVLHGAGGSENMFPEGYGSGRFVREAVAAGWLVLSPRAGATAVSDSLEWVRGQGVEVERLVVAGHSMGGGLALAASGRLKMDALVLFAPAGTGSPPSELPTFVAVGAGEIPMLKGRVEALGRVVSERANGEFRVYPAAEHLMVVAEGTDDALRFVEKWAGVSR